jgi:hypothetical protein
MERVAGGLSISVAVDLVAGDSISVRAVGGESVVSTSIPVVEIDGLGDGVVSGFAEQPAVNSVEIVGGRMFVPQVVHERAAVGRAVVIPGNDGVFRAEIVPHYDLTRSAAAKVYAGTVEGHSFVSALMSPVLFVGVGGEMICGYSGVGESEVYIEKVSNDQVWRTSVVSDRRGSFEVDDGALDKPIEAGDRITAILKNARLSTVVPDIQIRRPIQRPDGSQEFFELAGVGPAAARYYVFGEGGGCHVEVPRYVYDQATSANGRFSVRDLDKRSGDAQWFVFDDDSDVMSARKYVWWGMRAYLEEGKIEVVMSEWSSAVLSVLDEEGEVRRSVGLETKGVPRAVLYLSERMRRGDVIRMEVDGGVFETRIPGLAFDWSPGGDVVGMSDGAIDVSVELFGAAGGVMKVQPEWGEDGVFHVRLDAIAEAEMMLGEVIRDVRVVSRQAPVLEVVVETPGLKRRREGALVYLPVIVRR